ncbi:oligosaccharide flippase family protein [Sphingobacterium sp. SGL-16]|uniref:oligosaccharide flippase family protein n=1 Tax=Sphingobacterium sp. SGL-16 TaxID=2710883 RepID=UPI0013EA7A16|nr:oligosaccharide flippase family protein [Sphingobacterium sp. SGL-16]NGM73075.1 oligosaccharide flippase family protein [Sphingobacterium sp. SGL-16]
MEQKKENLRQRAYLNTVTSFIDYGSRAFSSFIVNPFIVKGLGGEFFGIWQMLTQITNYSNIVDLRASTILTWAVARDRESVSEDELRDYLTTTFFLVLLMLPIILLIASAILWYLPVLVGLNKSDNILMVRCTFIILIIAFIINKFVGVLEALLKGMNLSFKRMGLRASITVLSGGLSVIAVILGYGLVGLATVYLISTIFIGLSLWIVIKKNVSWFGINRFKIKQSKAFMKTSGWFMAWSTIQMVMTNSDKVLLGALASPILVSQYVLTMYLPNTIKDIVSQVISSTLPGIGKLYGNKEFDKLKIVKSQVFSLTWLFCCVMGCLGLLFNQSFIYLWIGEGHFGGQLVNLLLIIITVQYMFTYNDGILINISLNIKRKVVYGAFSALITIGLSYFLIKKYEILGLGIALICGRLIMSIAYPIIVANILQDKLSFNLRIIRMLVAIVSLYFVTYKIGELILITNWVWLILLGLVSFIVILIVSFYTGLNSLDRKFLWNNMSKIKLFKNKD